VELSEEDHRLYNGTLKIFLAGETSIDAFNSGLVYTFDCDVTKDAANLLINVDAGSIVVINGEVFGSFELRKRDPGILVLSNGANSYSNGTIIVNGMLLANNVSGSATGPGAVTVRNGGTLGGTGMVTGAVTVEDGATVAPGVSPGILTVGSVTFSNSAVFAVELGGTTPGSDHDQLVVTNTATLDGTLNLSYTNGFTASTGDAFTILTAGTASGTFHTVNYPDTNPDWRIHYESNQVTVTLPEPPEVTIDTPDQVVNPEVTSIDLAGTSSNAIGTLTWSNSATGQSDPAVGVSSWTADAVELAVGLNPIVVTASNDIGSTSATVTVKRLSDIETRLTVYYDFEGDFDDHPGAGVTNDTLTTVTGGSLTSDAPANAAGSTMSYSFDNRLENQTAQTDSWSPDLAGADQYTIMFWFKGDDLLQRDNNTRLVTVRSRPEGGTAANPAFQVEGFGQGHANDMDTRLNDPLNPPGDNLWFLPDADGVLGNDGNPSNDVWNHIAFVLSNRDGPSNGDAYGETFVNGISLGVVEGAGGSAGRAPEPSTGNPIGNTEGELVLGGTPAFTRGATGFLDDFALFEGVVPTNVILEIATGVRSPADTFTPYVAEIDPESIFSNATSLNFRVVFSGAVTNFNDAADVVVNHAGTSHTGVSISGAGALYQLTLTGLSGEGSFTISVDTNSDVQAVNGDPLLSSVISPAVTLDTIPPNATAVTLLTESPTTRPNIEFEVTFDVDVTGFNDAADVIVNHAGTANTGVSISGAGTNYNVTVLGVSGAGSFTVSVNTGSDVIDSAGNTVATSATSVASMHVVDTTPPEVVSIVPETLFVASTANTLNVTITFDEIVKDVFAHNILLNVSNLASVSVCTDCGGGGGSGGGGGNPAPEGDVVQMHFRAFNVVDGFPNATFTIEIDEPNNITDLAENPLAPSAITSAVVTVAADVYQLWAIAGGLTPGVNFEEVDNPDGDPNNNAAEFMRATDPLSGNDVFLRRLLVVDIGGTNYFSLTLPVPIGAEILAFNSFARFSFGFESRSVQVADRFLSSTDLVQGFPHGGVDFAEIVPALDGPVGTSPALPALPGTHEYRTIRLTTGTEVEPHASIFLTTDFDD
jgi:hypothetical protein